MNTSMVKPIGDRILIAEIIEEREEGLIVVPESTIQKYYEVVALGTGVITANGENVSPPFEIGDRVMLTNSGAGMEVKLPDVKLLNILGSVNASLTNVYRVINSGDVLIKFKNVKAKKESE